MFKKSIYLFTILSVLVTVGFGCKGLTAEQKAAVKPVNLNYWTTNNDLGQLQKFVADYRKMRPYVNINIRQIRDDELESQLTNALADDVAPDIISVNVRDLRNYLPRLAEMPSEVSVAKIYVTGQYVKETVVETEKISMPTAGGVKNAFISTVYNDAVIGGKIYGLPLAVDTMAIYYNKDLLDRAEIPEQPKTWNEFMTAVKAATRFNEKGDIVQSGVAMGTAKNIPYSFDILSLLMMQSGVKMAYGASVNFANGVSDAGPNHPALTALRFYTDFAQPTKEVYTWNEKMGSALGEFAHGKAVFYLGFASDWPKIQNQAPQLNIEVMPMLQLNEKNSVNVANYGVEAVVKKTKHPDEAWEFVTFMTKPENIKKYAEATHRPSPLRNQINEQKENPTLAPFAGQILNAENWYRGRNNAAAVGAFNNLITTYLQPVSSEKDQRERDRNLLEYTARLVQQTM